MAAEKVAPPPMQWPGSLMTGRWQRAEAVGELDQIQGTTKGVESKRENVASVVTGGPDKRLWRC